MGNSQIQYAYEKKEAKAIEGETKPWRHICLEPGEDLVCEMYPGIDTMKKAFLRSVEKYGDGDFLGTRKKVGTEIVVNPRTKKEQEVDMFGEYQWSTYQEVHDQAFPLAKAIIAKGLYAKTVEEDSTHQMMGIFAKNSYEWILMDVACVMTNLTSVTLYDTLGQDATKYIINQTELNTISMTKDKIAEVLKSKDEGNIDTVEHFICFDKIDETDVKLCSESGVTLHYVYDLVEEGKELEQKLFNPTRDSIYTLCYTSGTTGDPKGVKLSHISLISEGAALNKIKLEIYQTDRHLSYLPLAHVLERLVYCIFLTKGARIGFYQGDILKLKDDLAVLKPTIFVSVPRLFNRFYDGMMAKIQQLTGMKKKLADWAVARKLSKLEKSGDPTHGIYDRLVFNKFKDAIGGQVRFMLTGSAPISKDVINFLKIAFCCPFYEGYGQTECTGGSCLTFSEDGEAGHVGGVLPMLELKLVDVPELDYLSTDVDDKGNQLPRGEICFKGHSCFSGYFKLPDKTAETIDEAGWVHTGDIGAILENGALKIVDRKKNIFKLAQGEYIAPEKLENNYVKIDIVKQVFVYGDSLQSILVAVVIPEEDEIKKWAADEGTDVSNMDEFLKSEEFLALIKAKFEECRKQYKFNGLEVPKKFHFDRTEWTHESGMLTPTMKLKRADAKNKYIGKIKEMYDGAKLQGEE